MSDVFAVGGGVRAGRPVRFWRWAAAVLGTLAAAYGQGWVTGTVTNAATGATLEGARVVLEGAARETLTDNFGGYRIDAVPPGPATLSVSYTGLQTRQVRVTVAAGAPTRQDIGLTSDVYRLEKFVIASEREGNAKAITLQRLSDGVKNVVSTDAFGGLAGNPADLAMRLPGVEGESVGGDMRYVRIRGLSHTLSTITQDGNRMADAGSAGATREFQFQTVDSDSIERIEVTKSPTPDMEADSIGGAVNLVSKSAFDSSPERRLRGSVGAIWRATDPRDPARPNASLSYSEVFRGRLGVSLNLAYRPHGSIIDMSNQTHQLLPVGTEGPAFQYSLAVQDFRNVRTRSGAGLKLDFKVNDQVRLYTKIQVNKHIEHSDHSQATWQTNQVVATQNAAGQFTGTGGILPGYTDYETNVRAVPQSQVVLESLAFYKLGTTKTYNVGAVHRYRGLELDYDTYASKSKAYYPGNNTFSFTLPNVGWSIRKDEKLFPTVVQTAGNDWTRLENYTTNAYTSARMVGWDSYLGAAINARKSLPLGFPASVKTGLRWREQTRQLDNTPYRTAYVGPDGVMGPNPANGGRNDDNLGQFGLMNRPWPDTELGRYPSLPFPAFQAVGRIDNLDEDIAANPTHWRRTLAADLQAALQNNQQFTEDIVGAYLMGTARLFGKLTVLTGVRVEETKTEGEGALQVVTPEERARRAAWGTAPLTEAEIGRRANEEFGRRVRRSGEYRSVFPGLHLKYQFTPNLLARFSYSETIGRPAVSQLVPRTTVNYENQTVSTSNPSLEPQWSQNFDLSAELYFEPAGTFSVGLFQKDIEKFIFTAGGATIAAGADNGFGGEYAGFQLTTQYNGGTGKVRGIEVNYSQQFTFLPGFLKGLGGFANATWMEARGNYGAGAAITLNNANTQLAGFNPFVANAGLSYIRQRLNLRISYNYRDRYLATFNANPSRMVYAAIRPTVDVKTLFNVNRRLSFYFDVTNVFMEPDRERVYGFGRAQTTHLMRPQFYFGANLRN